MSLPSSLVSPERLREVLTAQAVHELEHMLGQLATDPTRLSRFFPGAARRTGRGEIGHDGVRIEDAVRVELVAAAAPGIGPTALLEELEELYRFGDADERRAVLLALSALDDSRTDGSALLLDALRSNDIRLVEAAMGPHAHTLSDHDWRHGVLKCLFVGAPLGRVADLERRADATLAQMVQRFVAEREAADRTVPDDALLLLDLTSPPTCPEA